MNRLRVRGVVIHTTGLGGVGGVGGSVRQCQRMTVALGGLKAGAFSLQPVAGAPGEGEGS